MRIIALSSQFDSRPRNKYYKYMEEYNKDCKLLHAIRGRTIRELVDKTNELGIQREDVVTILQENGYYVVLYYYQGI